MDKHSVTSASTSTTNTRGIRLHVKKQLAEDIEAGGGIQYFAGSKQNLAQLLNQKASEIEDHPYGQRGDKVRRQITQLVGRWKTKHIQGIYVSEVLNPWKIVQHSARMPTNTPRHQQSTSDDSSDSVSATPTQTKRNPKTPPRQVVVDSRTKQPSTPLTPLIAGMSLNQKRKIGNFDLDNVASQACKWATGF